MLIRSVNKFTNIETTIIILYHQLTGVSKTQLRFPHFVLIKLTVYFFPKYLTLTWNQLPVDFISPKMDSHHYSMPPPSSKGVFNYSEPSIVREFEKLETLDIN